MRKSYTQRKVNELIAIVEFAATWHGVDYPTIEEIQDTGFCIRDVAASQNSSYATACNLVHRMEREGLVKQELHRAVLNRKLFRLTALGARDAISAYRQSRSERTVS